MVALGVPVYHWRHAHRWPPPITTTRRPTSRTWKASASSVRVTYDADGNPPIHFRAINILVPGHRDIDHRQRVLDDHRVDTQVLTFTTPGVRRRGQRGAGARRHGARRPRAARRHLATLPLNDPAASVTELDRAMHRARPARRHGVQQREPRAQRRAVRAAWKKADDLGAVIYIHPTHPLGVEAMLDYWLMPPGFLDGHDARRLEVFSGVVERHPRTGWVLTCMGGAILTSSPSGWTAAGARSPTAAHRAPAERALSKFCIDTVNFDALAAALRSTSPGLTVFAGSDHPHQIGKRIPLDDHRGPSRRA
ncbi:MAG: amidohydrolase family protein [Candidatus Binatia bacterium]